MSKILIKLQSVNSKFNYKLHVIIPEKSKLFNCKKVWCLNKPLFVTVYILTLCI